MDFPRTVDEITPEWLTRMLRESGAIKNAIVRDFKVASTGDNKGVTGDVNRVLLEYDRVERGSPSSVVTKMALADDGVRSNINDLGGYEREVEFYRQFASTAGMRTPSTFGVEYDRESGYFIILLEDFGHLRAVDQWDDCSLADGSAVVQSLARMHAKWWEHELLFRTRWFVDVSNIESLNPITETYARGIDQFLETAADYLPDGYESLARKYGHSMVKTMQADGESPVTLTHGDFRLGNLLFDDANDVDNSVVAFDWQVAGRMKGTRDLAYFLSWSFTTESRRKYEKQFLADYHDSIVDLGVKDYSFEEFSKDIRLSALWTIRVIALATVNRGAKVMESEDGQKLFNAVWERMQTVIDWNCEEVIPK